MHDMFTSPNWVEADQLANYKHDRGIDLGSTEKQLQLSVDSNPHSPDSGVVWGPNHSTMLPPAYCRREGERLVGILRYMCFFLSCRVSLAWSSRLRVTYDTRLAITCLPVRKDSEMTTVVSMLCAPLLAIKLLWTFIGVKTMEEAYLRFELDVNLYVMWCLTRFYLST